MKKYISIIALTFLFSGLYAQENDKVLEKISTQLTSYYQNLPSEKIYVQTDKDIYAPGETIWFKAIVMDKSTQKISTLSADLLVKLFDKNGEIVHSDIFLLENGATNGDIKLPSVLARGRYYLVAYTPLQFDTDQIFTRLLYVDEPYSSDLLVDVMNKNEIFDAKNNASLRIQLKSLENEPEPRVRLDYSVFLDNIEIENNKVKTDNDGIATIEFDFPEDTGKKPLSVVFSDDKETWERTILVKTNNDLLNINFYPEGGSLVANMPQKVGIIACDLWGKAINFTGDIINKDGTVVTKCQTFTDGFGMVPVQLKEGEKYSLKITSEYGRGQTFKLPEAKAKNFFLSVLGTDDNSITVLISSTAGEEKNIVFTVTSGLQILGAGELTISGPSRFNIPTEGYPEGIAMLSVFDEQGLLLGKRLIYIDKGQVLNFSSSASKKVNIFDVSISASTENSAEETITSSVSVASSHNFLYVNSSIYQSLKYDSELANDISDISVINDGFSANKIAIDYILISNKLTDFSWDKILNFDPAVVEQLSDNQLGLSGKVIDKNNAVIPGAKVSILDTRTMKLFSQTSDDKGRFFFLGLSPVNAEDLTITATGPEGKIKYDVSLNQSFDEQLGEYIKQKDYLFADVDVLRENMLDFLALNDGLISSGP